jgi:parallel beta-helix repeat protein
MGFGRLRLGRRDGARALVAGALLVTALTLGGEVGAGAAPPCDKFAAPLGLDSSPGTRALPFRTAQRLADSLAPGQTGCLRTGTYTGGITVTRGGAPGSPVTIKSSPFQRAVIVGRTVVAPGAAFVTISDLDLVGLSAGGGPSPRIEADDVTLQGNDITNVHTAVCVFVGTRGQHVARAVITENRIHDCGAIPSTNRHHGVSVWNASDTQITRNVIFDNVDRGVQLYPNAKRSTVAYNTIDGNGEGIMISGGEGLSSDDNVIERNVMSNSTTRDNVETFWPAGNPIGSGNVLRSNCVWGGPRDNGDGGIAPRLQGLLVSGNLVAQPRYVDRAGKDFRLKPVSSCLAVISGSVFRAFSDSSPWNLPAAQKGSIDAGNPYADQFSDGGPSFQMKLSGTPDNPDYASPTFFAAPSDPLAPIAVSIPSWLPTGSIRWDGSPIPVPRGVYAAPGSDGHLTVVSADQRTAWEFWRAVKAGETGYQTSVVAQFDLTGPGYSDRSSDNSARGSGTPLISTTLRADEALNGIQHALGITVPRVSSSYLYPPATHTDGDLGPDAIKYGMLFVLRSDYPVPADASEGVRNVIQALKTYGAYVIDQGADFEMDADSRHLALWEAAGLDENSFDFTASDFRLVHTDATQLP